MYLLFDIGATKIRLAVSDGRGLGKMQIVSTPREFEEGIRIIASAASAFLSRRKSKTFTAVAGGVAGPLDARKAMLVNAPNLPLWNRKPLKESLRAAFKTKVIVENDTSVVGLGEACVGAGRWRDIVAYLTVSTGVGGVRIVRKKIDHSAMGFEPGHQIVDVSRAGESSCSTCGQVGCLEGFVGGAALERRFTENPAEIGDPNILGEAADILAVGLHNTIVHWSPDIVVLGGSVMLGKNPIPFDRVVLSLKKRMKIFSVLPEVRKATLGDFGGLWGSLMFLNQKK